jgi:DivIVA domain-containing protein
MLQPEEIVEKEFMIGMRGYVREEVHAYLRMLAAQLRERDERIAQLERANGRATNPTLAEVMSDEVQHLLAAAESVSLATKVRARETIEGVYSQANLLMATFADAQDRLRQAMSQMHEAMGSLSSAIAELPAPVEVPSTPQSLVEDAPPARVEEPARIEQPARIEPPAARIEQPLAPAHPVFEPRRVALDAPAGRADSL